MSKGDKLASIDATIRELEGIATLYRNALGGGKATQADVDRTEAIVRDWRIKRRAVELGTAV